MATVNGTNISGL